ncbi:hypothetical protein G7054_g11319 [Neopestalotiopsis clavispora]|nr:hypothetical protein G7054_g11319 [Neopestalotiopsis clavispora]
MAANFPLKWDNVEKQPRAAQIQEETWDDHKNVILELYKTKTLAELRQVMKTEHGFDATLGKWARKPAVTSESTPCVNQKPPDENLSSTFDLLSENSKRPISRQSIGSRISQCSVDPQPPSKKLRAASVEESNDIDLTWTSEESLSDLSRSEASEDARSISLSTSSTEVMTAKSTPQNSSGGHINFSRPYSSKVCLRSSLPSQATSPRPYSQSSDSIIRLETHSMKLEEDLREPPEGPLMPVEDEEVPPPPQQVTNSVIRALPQSEEDPGALPEGPLVPVEDEEAPPPQQVTNPINRAFSRPVTLEFCLEISRKLQNFSNLSSNFVLSRQFRDRLKILADRLFVTDEAQAAGNIYSVLLVSEESELAQKMWTQDRRVLTLSLIAAARSARTLEQRALVQKVLLKRLNWCREQEQGVGSGFPGASVVSAAEYFLAHVFVVECFVQQDQYFTTSYHLDQALSLADQVSKEGAYPLKTGMSTLFYLCYKRVYLKIPSSKEASISHQNFMAFCKKMGRNPDEEETQPEEKENQRRVQRISTCVRDCVTWCLLTVNENHLEMYRESSSFDAFGYAWEVWQQQTTIETSWMVESEIEVGIPAAEHLHICIELLCSQSEKVLSNLLDEDLLGLYLEALFDRIPQTLGQQRTGLDEKRNLSRASLAPTWASSIGSSNASLKNFKSVFEKGLFQSIKQRVTEAPLRAARGSSSYTASTFRDSHMTEMSQMSGVLEGMSIHEDDETGSM